jgi:hypothetical protein
LVVADIHPKQVAATRDAYAKIKSLAKVYHEDVSLRLDADFDLDGQNALMTMMSQFTRFLTPVC